MRLWVQSLASLRGSRIWRGRALWCGSQTWLGSRVAAALAQAGGRSSRWTPSLKPPYAAGVALERKKAKEKGNSCLSQPLKMRPKLPCRVCRVCACDPPRAGSHVRCEVGGFQPGRPAGQRRPSERRSFAGWHSASPHIRWPETEASKPDSGETRGHALFAGCPGAGLSRPRLLLEGGSALCRLLFVSARMTVRLFLLVRSL